MTKKVININKRRALKIGFIAAAMIIVGLVLFYGYNMIFKAENVTNPIKNKTTVVDSSGQTLGTSEVLIQVNESP